MLDGSIMIMRSTKPIHRGRHTVSLCPPYFSLHSLTSKLASGDIRDRGEYTALSNIPPRSGQRSRRGTILCLLFPSLTLPGRLLSGRINPNSSINNPFSLNDKAGARSASASGRRHKFQQAQFCNDN